MRNAVRFWGAQAGATTDGSNSTCAALTTAATGTETCNGDGNGVIGNGGQTGYMERHRFWQHLANAGLIEGTYSGVQGPNATGHVVPGINSPNGKISSSGFAMTHLGNRSGHASFFDDFYDHQFFFGTTLSTDMWEPLRPVVSPEEAWNIDKKIDDGIPGIGIVRSHKSTSNTAPNCTSTAVANTSEYQLTDSSILCALMIDSGF